MIQRDARFSADAQRAVDWYLEQAGGQVTTRFLAAVKAAVDLVQDFPQAGSPRIAHMTGRANIRAWQVRGFPYIVLYMDSPGVRLLRLLHTAREIPAVFQE